MSTIVSSYFAGAPREPSVTIVSGGGATRDRTVRVVISTIDAISGLDNAIEMKVWGSIDPNFRHGEFAAIEGEARWVDFEASFPVVLSVGAGTKTLNVQIRNSSKVATNTLTTTVVLEADHPPHPSLLWTMVPRAISADHPVRVSWSPSHDVEAWEIVMLPSDESLRMDGATIAAGDAVTAGSLVHTVIEDDDISASDAHAGQNGARILRLYVLVDSVWYASGGFGGEAEGLPEFNWDEGFWDEGVWA